MKHLMIVVGKNVVYRTELVDNTYVIATTSDRDIRAKLLEFCLFNVIPHIQLCVVADSEDEASELITTYSPYLTSIIDIPIIIGTLVK